MENPNLPNYSGEQPPSSTGGTTVVAFVSEAVPSIANTTTIPSNTHSGPILSPVRMQGQPTSTMTSFPNTTLTFTDPLVNASHLYKGLD